MTQEKNVWFQKAEKALDSIRQLESYFVVLELNKDDQVLVGSSELGGSVWTGSLWLYQCPEKSYNANNCIAAVNLDVGVSDAKFLPSGSAVLAADYSSDLSMFELTQGGQDCPVYFTRSSNFVGHDSYVTSIDIASNQSAATGSSDYSIITWDLETQLAKSKFSNAHADSVSAVAIQPEQDVVFASASYDRLTLLWDARCDSPASKLADSDVSFTCLDWIDPYNIVVGDEAGCVRLVDIRMRDSCSTESLSSKYAVKRVRVNKSNKTVAFAVDDPSVKVMRWRDGKLSPLINVPSRDMVRGLAWSTKTGLLLSCGWDSIVSSHSVPDT